MQELQQKGKGLCFKLLFPQVAGAINPADYNTPALMQRRLDTDNRLVQTSYETPRSNSSEEQQQARQEVQQIVQQLGMKYGDDLQMLLPPQRNDVDHDKVCEMSIDLYRRILALPAEQSGRILRMMLGGGD